MRRRMMTALPFLGKILLFCLAGLSHCQSDDDSALHFGSTSGRAVWIVDELNLPWLGSYEYLSSQHAEPTVLLTVVDSSTGVTLGECATKSHGSKWVRFQWVLASDSMQCTVSPTNSSRIEFPASSGSRSFSVRIQGARGPACMREIVVNNEKPIGCPPRLSRNSFSSVQLSCGCPSDPTVSSGGVPSAAEPQFPIFELGVPTPAQAQTAPVWAVSPCAQHHCEHNGSCVVTEDGKATCFCRPGFAGSRCETDVCANVPCQNGGVCKADGTKAVCECREGFEGILCESPICNPQCTNGECVVTNGTAHCQCRQGFIGINCNIIDVCLGDAACAMWGDLAKCVLDDSSYIMNSPHLVNATFDCRCPHPDNGEYLDCLELHISSSTAPPSPPLAPHGSPTFPVVNMSVMPGLLPTTRVPAETEDASSNIESTQELPMAPHQTFAVRPNPAITHQVPHVAPTLSIHTAPPTTASSTETTTNPPTESVVETTTFVFPQTPQTTRHSSLANIVNLGHQPTHAVVTTGNSEHGNSHTLPFPTPSPMDLGAAPHEPISSTVHFIPFHAIITSTTPESITSAETETVMVETTTVEDSTADYDEHTTETESEEPSTIVHVMQPETTMMTTQETTESVTMSPIWAEATEETVVESLPTTQSTLPFWMFSTQGPSKPQQPVSPMSTELPSPHGNEQEHGHETVDHEPSEEDEDTDHSMTSVEMTSSSPDVHQQADRQKSSVASWVVAIVALIVLGLVLLAAALFVLRYIKQSRKLHGKYNPAREEHALSAAYSMPMSHIAKEERLI